MSKRIVFIFRSMATGGAQKIEAFVANALAESGYSVIALNMSSQTCNIVLNNNIKVINLYYDTVEKCNNKLFKFLLKILYLIRLRLKIISLQPDLICAFLSDVVRVIVLACKNLDIPIIGSERGDPGAFSKKQLSSYKDAYEKCVGVVFQLPKVKKIYDLPDNVKQQIIPNPCFLKSGQFLRRKHNGKHIIVGAGRLTIQKRFDVLIAAFEIVMKKHSDYNLEIYGDGPLKSSLQEYIEKNNLSKNVSLMGDVSNVFANPDDIEMFVLSSDYEGIPNILLEALACGIPCISTDCRPGGARYLLGDNERGLIVPCDNSDLLAQAMEEYINNPNLRKLLGAKSKTVLNDFEPVKIKTLWLNFIEDVMDKKS